MTTAFDDAAGRAFGNCFDVLLDGLTIADDDPQKVADAVHKFKRGCDLVRKAKAVADAAEPIARKTKGV